MRAEDLVELVEKRGLVACRMSWASAVGGRSAGRRGPGRRSLVSLTRGRRRKRPAPGWAVVGNPPHLPASGMIWSPVAVLRHSRPLPLTSDAVSSENPW